MANKKGHLGKHKGKSKQQDYSKKKKGKSHKGREMGPGLMGSE